MHVNQALDVGATGINITTSGTSASGTIPNAADGNKPKYCYVCTTAACRIRWGKGAQTAVATDLYLPADEPMVIKTVGADTIAAIQQSAAGSLTVTPLEWTR